MWDRLRRQVAVELEQLNHLIDVHRPLVDRCKASTPNEIELSAMAAMLHGFYTGIENILKRVCTEVDEVRLEGEMWHRGLLDLMAEETDRRPALVSGAVREALREYLGFRHVFRQAYSFELRWGKMQHLVLGCEGLLRRIEADLGVFLRSGEAADQEA